MDKDLKLIGIICLTIIICVALMTSCAKVTGFS
jgi:hypothetical protein